MHPVNGDLLLPTPAATPKIGLVEVAIFLERRPVMLSETPVDSPSASRSHSGVLAVIHPRRTRGIPKQDIVAQGRPAAPLLPNISDSAVVPPMIVVRAAISTRPLPIRQPGESSLAVSLAIVDYTVQKTGHKQRHKAVRVSSSISKLKIQPTHIRSRSRELSCFAWLEVRQSHVLGQASLGAEGSPSHDARIRQHACGLRCRHSCPGLLLPS